jgi:uncharacterized membrane-anchored protein
MSISSSRLLASVSAAVLAGALFAVPEGLARDLERSRGDLVLEMAPMSRDASREIIYVMPPLKPVGKSAAAAKPAPAKVAEPAKPVAPAKIAEPAKPVEPAKTAEPAKAAEPAKVAEQAKPAEPQKAAEPAAAAEPAKAAEPEKPAPSAVAEAPKAAAEPAAAPEAKEPTPAVAEAAKPADAEAPPAPPPGAETPPQAAAPEVASAPPAGAQEAHEAAPAAGEQAAAASPAAPSEARPPAAPPAQAPEQAPPAAASAEPALAAPAPVAENNVPAPPKAQEPDSSEPAPADPAQAAAAAEARIAALLKEGVKGPAEIRIADRATMWLPSGRVFVPGEPAQKLAKEAGLELRPGAQGLVAPAGETLSWLAPVELLDDGFVKTGEADALQAEKLLAAFRAGLPEVNANRAKSGQPAVSLDGWLTPPALDDKHRLSACVNVGAEGGDKFFNCEAWALGRQGAIKVSVAEGGEQAEKMKGEALALAETIVYDHGKAYEDIDVTTDKAAPYAAADLLTSDVSAKTVAPAPAAASEEGGLSPLTLVAKLWKLILSAVIAIGGVIAWFRRRNAQIEAKPVKAEPKPVEDGAVVAEKSASLFERMLPTLHARFARKKAPAPASSARGAGVDAVSARVARAEEPRGEKAAAGGLLDKLSAMRFPRKTDAAEPGPLAIADEAEEPASALKRLASKMRGAPEAQPAPVDVARVIRAARGLSGAAPEPEDETKVKAPALREPAAPAPVAPKFVAPAPDASEARKDDAPAADAFGGLVEPGDEAATSAAMHAREALRQASA